MAADIITNRFTVVHKLMSQTGKLIPTWINNALDTHANGEREVHSLSRPNFLHCKEGHVSMVVVTKGASIKEHHLQGAEGHRGG